MNEVELEQLVVRLTGDSAQYQSMIHDAVGQTETAAKDIGNAANKFEKSATSGIGSLVQGTLGALAALGGKSFLEDIFHKYAEAERGDIRLQATLKANGREVEKLTKQYQEFADAMEAKTTLDDDAVKSLLRSAETYGLTGKAAQQATQDSISLAAVTGHSAEGMMRMAAQVKKGNIEAAMTMARMIPQLRGVKDETEFLAKYNQLLATGLETSEAEAKSSLGTIQQLTNAYDNFKEELGAVVAEGIKPIVDTAKAAVGWFRSLSDETKSTIVAIIGTTVAVLGLSSAITLAGIVFNTMFGGVGVLIGAIVTAGVGAAAIVGHFGGIGAALESVKKKGIEAWEWLKPVRQALMSFWGMIVEGGTWAWEKVKEVSVEVWNAIVGDVTVDWEQIRTTIQKAILIAEFGLRNFGSVATFVWTGAKLGFVSFVGEIQHFFDNVMPAYLMWFGDNWYDVFLQAVNNSSYMIENLVKNIGKMIGNLPGIISGEIDAKSLWTPLTDGFVDIVKDLPKIPAREMGALEQSLMKEFLKQGDALKMGWDEFYQSKLKEFAADDQSPLAEEADDAADEIQDSFKKASGEVQKFDAVLANSAEAWSRITEYRDKIAFRNQNGQTAVGGKDGGVMGGIKNEGGMEAIQNNAGVQRGGTGNNSVEKLLMEIRDTLVIQANKETLPIEFASIGVV